VFGEICNGILDAAWAKQFERRKAHAIG